MPKNCIMVALKHRPAIHWVMGPIHCGQSVVITARIVAKGVMGPIHCGQSVVITARIVAKGVMVGPIHCGQSVVITARKRCERCYQQSAGRNTLWPKRCVIRARVVPKTHCTQYIVAKQGPKVELLRHDVGPTLPLPSFWRKSCCMHPPPHHHPHHHHSVNYYDLHSYLSRTMFSMLAQNPPTLHHSFACVACCWSCCTIWSHFWPILWIFLSL